MYYNSIRMRVFLLLVLAFVSFLLTAQDAFFKKDRIPQWVTIITNDEPSEINKYDLINGNYFSILDFQSNVNEQTDFFHVAIDIVSESGVSSVSEIAIVFDTSYEKVIFHSLLVKRGDLTIDRTQEVDFELIRYEDELSQSMYSGKVKAYTILEDIRKGDILEYSYSSIGENPIYEGKVYRHLPLQDINPIDLLFIKMITNADEPLYTFYHKCAAEDRLSESINEGKKEFTLLKRKVQAAEIEGSEPSWFIPYSYISFSSYDNWSDVNAWAMSVFDIEGTSDSLQTIELNRLIKTNMSQEDKITTLIDFVQNDIRYMAVESGIGSIKPYHPENVLKKRFGDCKDKSLLLVNLLKMIGLEQAYPALVSTTFERNVDQNIPGGQIFDHCIVNFNLDGTDYWVDPTIPFQGGSFKQRISYNYKKALVIKPKNRELSNMIIENLSRSLVVEKLEIPNFEDPVLLTSTQILNGNDANFFRLLLEYYSSKEVSDDLRASYNYLYHNIEADGKLKIEDDRKNNKMLLTEKYIIDDLWESSENNGVNSKSFQYEPIKLYAYLNSASCETKEHPVAYSFPSQYEQTTIIELPALWNLESETETFDNEAFSFTKSAQLSDNHRLFTINYKYESKSDFIAPENYKKVCKELNSIVNDLPLILYMPID
jgi:hypothetical protein